MKACKACRAAKCSDCIVDDALKYYQNLQRAETRRKSKKKQTKSRSKK